LNTTAHIEGQGISLDQLSSSFRLNVEKSEFRGLTIPPSDLTIDAHNNVISLNGSLALDKMISTVSATLDRRERENPTFSIDASLNHLDIASIAHDDRFDSDITLKLQARGHGLRWPSLGGEALVDLSSSRYRDYRLASGDFHILLDQSVPASKQFSITSPIADISLSGAFSLETLTRLVRFEIQNLRSAIAEKFRFMDSSLVPEVDHGTLDALRNSLAAEGDTTNVRYRLAFKDLEPISAVAGETPFRGEGNIAGTVRGTFSDMALDGTLDAKYFFLGNVENGFLLQNARIGFALDHLQPVNPLHVAAMQVRADAEKMNLKHSTFDSLAAGFSYGREYAQYDARALWNGESRVAFNGTATVTDAGFAARLDSLFFAYKDFAWVADSTTTLSLTSDKASLAGLVFRHDTSVVRVGGSLAPGGMISADVIGERLNLADLRYLVGTNEKRPEDNLFRGSADVHVLCEGSFSSPRFQTTLRAEGVAFKRIPFGKLSADFQYSDTTLRVSLLGGMLGATDSVDSAITIRGTLPLNLAFTSVDERLPDRPMDLTVLSRGMQISILDPLLPTFDELSGLLRCKVTVGGSPHHPHYAGSMTLDRCQFLFVPNNIRYSLNAVLQPDGENIRVVDAEIRNVAADERAARRGEMHIRGDLSLRNFKPGDFNLVGTGSLLVVKETSRLSSLSLYGNLFMETGKGGLRFTGEIENSTLRGSVIISNSNLVFPPTEANIREESQLSIPLAFVDDTTKVHPTVSHTALSDFFGEDSSAERTPGSSENIGTKSFLDGVHYDLDVETIGGNTQIKMIFNAITNEELVANIEGRLNITGDGTQWLGDLTVSRAYYNFFRRFNAEGTLRFHGNMMNPELDLEATYQGQRADTSGRGTENIIATFKITGTRFEPQVDISMTINGQDYYTYVGPKSNDVKNDAIEFILYGNFPLSSSQRASASTDIGSTVSSSIVTGATSLLTGALSEFLRNETGIINSVEFSYGAKGSLGESADIRLSGVAWNGLWHYGGKILDNPFSNANFSVLYSLGTIFNRPSLRNLMFELQRKVELNTLSPTNELKAVNS
ncbi:MAG: translocation/assembly module TamB domain-containing protein, partial [Bacteroidota bacterium]